MKHEFNKDNHVLAESESESGLTCLDYLKKRPNMTTEQP